MAGLGEPKTGGRKKGTPNKVTLQLREAVLQSFENLGGVKYLEKLAKIEPRSYAMLLARVLPTQVEADLGLTTVIVRNYTGIEWEEKARVLADRQDH